MDEKIIQIIPAPSWLRAKFSEVDGYWTCPVLCLALVEDGQGYRYVRLIDIDDDGYTDFSNDCSNFAGVEFEEGYGWRPGIIRPESGKAVPDTVNARDGKVEQAQPVFP